MKIGLALSGGGSKGAFIVGALESILGRIFPDGDTPDVRVVAGTSTGALIASGIAADDFQTVKDVYENVETKNIVNPHVTIPGVSDPSIDIQLLVSALTGQLAVFSTAALRGTIGNIDFDEVKRRADDDECLMICTTVDLQFGKLHSFNSRDVAPAVLKEAVLASASMPVLTDPVDLPSTAAGQIRQHVDGGVREVLPLADVFRSEVPVDHIFAISTCPLSPSREGRYSNLLDILARTVDLLTVEVTKDDLRMAQAYNAIVKMLENGLAEGVSRNKLLAGIPAEIRDGLTQKSSVPVTFIAPPAHLDMDCLVFKPPELRAAIKLGRETAFDVLEQEFP